MRNKIIYFTIALFVLALAGLAVYYFSANRKVQPPQQESREQESQAESTNPEVLVAEPVISPILSFSGETIWFMNTSGRMFRQNVSTGERVEFPLPESIDNPVRVIWQNKGNNFILEQNLLGHTRYKFYDADLSTLTEYPSQMRKPAFSHDDKRIVYDWLASSGQHELKISDQDGENFQKIADLFRPDYEIVASPVKNEVVLSANGSKLFLTDLITGFFRELDQEAEYAGAKFSPDGEKLLVQKNGSLVVYDLEDSAESIYQYLEISREGYPPGVWASDRQVVYATSRGVSLYNLERQETKLIYEFSEAEKYSPTALILHPSNPVLFFVDENTGYLYKLDLE